MEIHEWHKHPSFKNLFETEISILSRGLNGDFKLLKLEIPDQTCGQIIAIGELSFGEGNKQGIKIIFPAKYPFAPPKVISGVLNFDEDGNFIEPFIPIEFGKGNQYSGGALCLFETGFWNKDQHNIGWVLKRAQKWLRSVNSQNGFSKEEIIEEYPAFMQHIGQVLIPKEIVFPTNAKSGLFELTQFKPNYYILEKNILPESTFSLNINAEIFKWYKFETGVTLRKLFPNMEVQTIVNIFINYFCENIFNGESQKNVALYLPSEENPWHFFKLVIQRIGNQVIFNPPLYFISRIISNELYLRTKDIFDDEILLKKRVTIIGLGAIGSEVAKSLAKNGVGHFNLFDMDTFEIGNSIRHAADLFYIGEPKVNVVKQLILRSNPNITVNSYIIDVLNDTGLLEKSLNESDLCIILTAEDSVEYLINDHYIKNFDIPFIFARASVGALSGSVQVVDFESACLRCLSEANADNLPYPKNRIRFSELKPEYGSCSSPALPGSEIDTKEIALQVARISIQCLMQQETSSYPKLLNKQFYWHGPYGSEEKEPFTWEMKNLEKNKDCKICK